MPSRLVPLFNQCLKLAGRINDWKACAASVTVIAAEETSSIPPAIYLDNQLEKATATVPGLSSLEDEIALATTGQVKHAAVIRYTFRDCIVHGAGFDVFRSSYRKTKLRSPNFLTARIKSLPRALYCMSSVSHQYFGHWLQDACPTALLAERGQTLLLDKRPDWPNVAEYLEAFSLAPATGPLHHVETLTLYQDYGQGSSKRLRLNELRRRLAKAFPFGKSGSQAVYMRRGKSGARRVAVNDDEVTAGLIRQGFDVFDIEGASVSEIYARTRNARVVVGMEGSHLNHLHFTMAPGANLIALVPADRFVMLHRGLSLASGLRFGFVVIDPVEGGYRVNLDDLTATLDML